jgi:transposase
MDGPGPETGAMAPMLYLGLSQLGLPVVCIESRQAHQAFAGDAQTDRNDAAIRPVPQPSLPRWYAVIRQRRPRARHQKR